MASSLDAPPSPSRAGAGGEDGLTAPQRRAKAAAAKYKAQQDREMASKLFSGKVWQGIAMLNAVRVPAGRRLLRARRRQRRSACTAADPSPRCPLGAGCVPGDVHCQGPPVL